MDKRYALITAAEWEPLVGRVGLLETITDERAQRPEPRERLRVELEDGPLYMFLAYARNVQIVEITEEEVLAVVGILEAMVRIAGGEVSRLRQAALDGSIRQGSLFGGFDNAS